MSLVFKRSNAPAMLDQRASLVNQQLLQNVARLLGVGAGAGLLVRGVQGAHNIGRKVMQNQHANNPLTIDVPVPGEEEEKLAGASFLEGGSATDWTGHPMALPMSATALGVGAVGGWSLLDYVMDKRRKAQMKQELDNAKQQYEKSLLAAHSKQASQLGRDLDRLFDLLQEKQASGTWGDTAGQLTGAAATGAGALALISGIVAHNLGGKRRQQALLQKALRRRRREQALSQSTRIYAVPRAVPLSPAISPAAPSEDELNGSPLDKTARRGVRGVR